MTVHRDDACPCGSGRPLGDCCGRYLAGAAAPTAEALMRSRYSAFVLGAAQYLLATWHPERRPAELTIDPADPKWLGLTILRCEAGGEGDDEGVVEFEARCKVGGRADRLRERSRFVRREGRWLYLDGEVEGATAAPPGRNAPCPCGSGKKYKRCCGR